ncbi:iron-siderophore ABC transporter substrate-binding protein [Amycolatopsis sp. K13G38]|uniref:Iron-siderophore ABC transporter substrate-binding protein n=1 Tax=Amycolatopsis acididurans TaxID=2724524 RepID=A0ABX1IV47_9PSEU|nr:iron-siderophore ABC transporter substrate-binding protein [Amycolatopsis acididurans]NKQ51321.1 iron-siderophore ABC transporter substrate-binding protein [Amycolatopsis acididurans]
MSGTRPRGRVAALVCLLGAVLALAGCGGSGSGDATPEAGSAPAAEGAFPVTIPTAFGDVTVPSRPKRVVALGWGDAEVALTLGVQPVGEADWLAIGDNGVADWVPQDKRYTTAPKSLGTLDVDMEQVAALQPDLILDTRASGERDRYDKLSGLGVPVVSIPQGAESYRTTWTGQLDLIGKALGKTAEAAKVRTGLESKFAQTAAAHPEFTGRTVVVGSKTAGSYGAYVAGDSRVDFMTKLGFVPSPKVQALAGEGFSVTISPERMDLLDADLTVISPIGVTAEQINADPLFQAVPSVRAGHGLVLSDQSISQAFASATPLGLSWAIDKVVPLVAQTIARPGR